MGCFEFHTAAVSSGILSFMLHLFRIRRRPGFLRLTNSCIVLDVIDGLSLKRSGSFAHAQEVNS